jgi:ribose/xylose/arabinose/galactoside ABC-type transport system permease subunit
VHGLILADLGNDWSLGGSIMTFAIPVGLFVVVAAILWFLLSRPHSVPGHRDLVPAGGAKAAAATDGNEKTGAAPGAEDGS